MAKVQQVKIVTSNRNRYATAMRAAITGRNAAADAEDMDLYRLFDEAFDMARISWENAQQDVFEKQFEQ